MDEVNALRALLRARHAQVRGMRRVAGLGLLAILVGALVLWWTITRVP